MIEGELLRREHLDRIEPQQSQQHELTEGVKDLLAEHGGWAAIEGDHVVGIFSLYEVSPGRLIAYTIMSKHMTPRHLRFLARKAREFLFQWGQFRRVEAYVLEGAEREAYWCERVLGMVCEGKLRKWTPDGRGCYIYAYVSED